MDGSGAGTGNKENEICPQQEITTRAAALADRGVEKKKKKKKCQGERPLRNESPLSPPRLPCFAFPGQRKAALHPKEPIRRNVVINSNNSASSVFFSSHSPHRSLCAGGGGCGVGCGVGGGRMDELLPWSPGLGKLMPLIRLLGSPSKATPLHWPPLVLAEEALPATAPRGGDTGTRWIGEDARGGTAGNSPLLAALEEEGVLMLTSLACVEGWDLARLLYRQTPFSTRPAHLDLPWLVH